MPAKPTSQTIRRVALVLYAACLASAIFVYFVVSAMQVPYAAYLQASDELVRGRPNAARGMVTNAKNGLVLGSLHQASLVLRRDGADIESYPLAPQAGGIIEAQFTPSEALEPGTYDLVLRAKPSPSDPVFESHASITLLESPREFTWPTPSARLPAAEQKRARNGSLESEGPIRVDIIPSKPVIARGLPSEVFITTSERATGRPVRCSVNVDEAKGITEGDALPRVIQTNKLGLARVTIAPTTNQHWELSTTCQPEQALDPPPKSSATIQVGTTASQLSMRGTPQQARPNDTLLGSVQTLHRDGGIYVDLYDGEHWVWSGSFAVRQNYAGWRLPIPTQPSSPQALYRVQIFNDIYNQGFAWDVAYIAKDDAARDGQLDDLLTRHVKHGFGEDEPEAKRYFEYANDASRRRALNPSRSELDLLTSALLTAAPREFQAPNVLINSYDEDQRELDAWKSEVRARLLVIIGMALVVGLGVLGLVVLWGVQQAQRRQQLYREVDMELAEQDLDDAIDASVDLAAVARHERLSRLSTIVQAVVVLGTLVIFAACIMLLMHYMM